MTGLRGRASVIEAVCGLLAASDPTGAASILRADYPHTPEAVAKRGASEAEMLATFIADGFVDRYSGDRLLFPGVLHVLSAELPSAFPYHKNWKMSETHPAFWELMPTLDHVVPIARGGMDAPENWVTTSMLRNSAKSNGSLEELGWKLVPRGDLRVWDGLMAWFSSHVERRPDLLSVGRVARWDQALRQVQGRSRRGGSAGPGREI